MPDKKTYLSKEKHRELIDELDFLKTTRRQEIAEQLEIAKSFGDLSENAEYHEARSNQAGVEQRIFELENMLKNVEIVKHHKSDVAEVGTAVTLDKKGGDTVTYELVGSAEADTAAGKISVEAPLGKAILGKKKGETFDFVAPSGKKFVYILKKIS